MIFALINSILILNCIYQVRSECVLNINDIQAQIKSGAGNVDDREKGNLMLEVLGSDQDVRIYNTIKTDKVDAQILRKGKKEDTEKRNRTHESPYDFDDTICKIVGNRVLCGYDKNMGEIPDPKQVIDLGDGCVIRKNRIECNYTNGIDVGREDRDLSVGGGRQADTILLKDVSLATPEANSTPGILRTESRTTNRDSETQQSTNTTTQKITEKAEDLTTTTIPTSFEQTIPNNFVLNKNKENKTKPVITYKIKIRKNVSCDVKSFVNKLMVLLKSGKISGYPDSKDVSEKINTLVTDSSSLKKTGTASTRKQLITKNSDLNINNTTYTISIKQLREFIHERSKTLTTKDNKIDNKDNSVTTAPTFTNKTENTGKQITETEANAKRVERSETTKQNIKTTTCPTCPFKKPAEHPSNLNIFNILRDVTKQPVKAVTICVDKQDYIYCYDRTNLKK